MRILVLGGGQVASAVTALVPAQHEVLLRPRTALDIVDAAAVTRAVQELNPDCIVNAAAYTAVDLAED
jgi:dTDP-4-dehydrorhamnose reductase